MTVIITHSTVIIIKPFWIFRSEQLYCVWIFSFDHVSSPSGLKFLISKSSINLIFDLKFSAPEIRKLTNQKNLMLLSFRYLCVQLVLKNSWHYDNIWIWTQIQESPEASDPPRGAFTNPLFPHGIRMVGDFFPP